MITCYALLRKTERNLYLSPYLKTDKTAALDAHTPVVLKSSGMLTKNQKDEASYALYTAIDFAVDRWIQDKRYVPRLLICAVVFMVTYFFMSLAIRDPIPMVDEMLGSIGLTVFTWIALSKRDIRSSIAQQRRYELKGEAGSPDFQILEGLFTLESFLQDISNMDTQDLCDELCLVEQKQFELLKEDQRGPWAAEFLELLLLHIKVRDKALWNMFHTVLSVRQSRKSNMRLAQRMFHLSLQQKLDLPLLTLAIVLSEEIS